VRFVRRVQHDLRTIQAEHYPLEKVVVTGRCLDDFEAKHVAIEAHRRGHVKDLKQCANSAHFDAHDPPPCGLTIELSGARADV
jgi:hypothetical protein